MGRKRASGWWYRFRSAVTGRFVSEKDAARNEDTTVREQAGDQPRFHEPARPEPETGRQVDG